MRQRVEEERGRIGAAALWDQVKFIVVSIMDQQSGTRRTRPCSCDVHYNGIRLGPLDVSYVNIEFFPRAMD